MRTHCGRLVFPALSIAYLALSGCGCGGTTGPESPAALPAVVQCTITRHECVAGVSGCQYRHHCPTPVELPSSPTTLLAHRRARAGFGRGLGGGRLREVLRATQTNPEAITSIPGCKSVGMVLTDSTTRASRTSRPSGLALRPGRGAPNPPSTILSTRTTAPREKGAFAPRSRTPRSRAPRRPAIASTCRGPALSLPARATRRSINPPADQFRDQVVDLIKVVPNDSTNCSVQPPPWSPMT